MNVWISYQNDITLQCLLVKATNETTTKEDSVTALSYIFSTAKLAVFLCFYKFSLEKF